MLYLMGCDSFFFSRQQESGRVMNICIRIATYLFVAPRPHPGWFNFQKIKTITLLF